MRLRLRRDIGMPRSGIPSALGSPEGEREFELAAGESVTVTGITRPIEVGAVGPVNERDTYAAEGVIGMVCPELRNSYTIAEV